MIVKSPYNKGFKMALKDRKEREKEYRKKTIIEAAQKVFSENGYANALMENIAQEAELGKGTLYRYFKSKDEILICLVRTGMESLNQSLEQQLSNNECTPDLIRIFIREELFFYKNNLDLFKIIFQFIHSIYWECQDVLQKEIGHYLRQHLDTVNKMLNACQKNGVLFRTGLTIEKLANILEHMILATMMNWLKKSPPNQQKINQEAIFISQIFLQGVQATSQ